MERSTMRRSSRRSTVVMSSRGLSNLRVAPPVSSSVVPKADLMGSISGSGFFFCGANRTVGGVRTKHAPGRRDLWGQCPT